MYEILDEVINFIEKNMKTSKVEDSRRENLTWSEDPKKYISKRCSITIIIYNCDDATQPHTQKMQSRIQT